MTQAFSSRAVLVVDDDTDIREMVALVLELHGIRALAACDGVEALARARGSRDIGVVLLDLMMPKMDGIAAFEEMKRDPALASIPVIIMSGNRDAEAAAHRMHADGYLLKPMETDDLIHAVMRFVPVDQARLHETRPA